MERNKYLYPKDFRCPLCEQKFSSLRVRTSFLKKIKDDTDFCPYYKDVNPIYYEVIVCPFCGYSSPHDNFDDLDEEKIEILIKKVYSSWKEKDYTKERDLKDSIDCYRLALYCGQHRNLTWGIMATLSLRLAWLYRFAEDKGREEQFLGFAKEGLEKAYINEKLPIGALKEDALLYLLGELSYRLQEYDEAVIWFSRQIQLPKHKNRPFIERRTRDQWALAQEKRKKIKKEPD